MPPIPIPPTPLDAGADWRTAAAAGADAAASVASADAMTLDAFLADVRRRVQMRDVSYAALAGAGLLLAGAIVASLVSTGSIAGLATAALVASVGLAAWLFVRASSWREPVLLPLVESRQPEFRNLLVTSRELTQHPPARQARHPSQDLPRRRADRRTHRARRDRPVTRHDARDDRRGGHRPHRRDARVRRIALARRAPPLTRTRPATDVVRHAGSSSAPVATGVRAIAAIVTPPSYPGRPMLTLNDPARIEALAGSRLRLRVDVASGPTRRSPSTISRRQPFPRRLANDGFSRPSCADGDGRAEHRRRTGRAAVDCGDGDARSAAEPSRSSRPARICCSATTPRASRLACARRTISGCDRSRCATRRSRAPASSTNSTKAICRSTVTRTDARQWQGSLERTLKQLQLAEGDLLVYYAVAHDGRPGDEGRAVSDSFVIEIGKAGIAIAGGFAIPPEEERFAISLSALIQKTEKLHAKRDDDAVRRSSRARRRCSRSSSGWSATSSCSRWARTVTSRMKSRKPSRPTKSRPAASKTAARRS